MKLGHSLAEPVRRPLPRRRDKDSLRQPIPGGQGKIITLPGAGLPFYQGADVSLVLGEGWDNFWF